MKNNAIKITQLSDIIKKQRGYHTKRDAQKQCQTSHIELIFKKLIISLTLQCNGLVYYRT